MHLSYKTARYKGTIYKSYSIAESYREGNKVKKRIIWPIGKLPDDQAHQIRLICKMVSDSTMAITTMENIIIQESKPFLELAVVGALWDEWRLWAAFAGRNTESELPTQMVAKILTMNRCVSPCSHYSIPHWVQKTALPEILGHSLKNLNEDKIYYELDKIAQNQQKVEEHLFRVTYQRNPKSYEFVNYDLSSSYFVGMKCTLSQYGRSKDDKPHNKQVILGLMVNDEGYPFKWDIYPGNTAEVDTLVSNANACRSRFRLKDITMVFDRGIVSGDNLDYISDQGMKYISALDRDQIPHIEGINLAVFGDLRLDNFKKRLGGERFVLYDDSLYFKDLGQINGRRYILGFNPVLFEEERRCRYERIGYFNRYLFQKNQELKEAKRSRKHEETKQNIVNELKRLKLKKYFHDPALEPIQIQRINKKGQSTTIQSFSITVERREDKMGESNRLDGVCAFVSNHTQKNGDTFLVPAQQIIRAYREKAKIEDAFKHIKSFLKVRPFYVNTDDHVRAVYTVCIVAYAINKDLADRREKTEGIDYLNSKNLYEPFRSCHYVTVKDTVSHGRKGEPVELTPEQKELLKKLNIKVKMPKKACSP